jgi:acyl-CoA reductase-like NAD-dependent aldehyde dehydrogenase
MQKEIRPSKRRESVELPFPSDHVFVGGRFVPVRETYPVRSPYRGEVMAEAGQADTELLDQAVEEARRAMAKPYPVRERAQVLYRVSQALAQNKEPLAHLLAREAGKPLRDARVEVDRAVETTRLSAEEATRIHGEEIPVAAAPGGEGRLAFTIRRPYGVVLAITPFNFPLNLVLHKVGPALAAGASVVLKPAPATPLTALYLAYLFQQAGLRPGWLQVVTASGPQAGEYLVAHPDVALITFTGSAAVGEAIRRAAGLRPVLLELGNNGAVIVHRDADLELAAHTSALRSFAFAGQVCIAVQRVYVHQDVYAPFQELFLEASRGLPVGDPEDEDTVVGPMIHETAARRAEEWVQEAVHQGAQPLLLGTRERSLLSPTVLAHTPPDALVMKEEAFAPVVNLVPYRDLDEVIAQVNNTRYGLQAGVFTRSLDVAMYVAQRLEMGGVIVNDTPSYRVDLMPYGGIKASGYGREGPRYAIEHMTYLRTVVLNLRPPQDA